MKIMADGLHTISRTTSKILANVWDGGGNDTYVLTNHSQAQFIDLRPGGWMRFRILNWRN